MVKTKIINQTTHDVESVDGNAGIYRDLTICPPMGHFYKHVDPNATYREFELTIRSWRNSSKLTINISSDDFIDSEEIVIYETIENRPAWRMTKERGSHDGLQPLPSTEQQTPLQALLSQVISIIYETIEKIPSWRINKLRTSHGGMQPLPSQDLAAFNALRADASSRIANVKTDCVSLAELILMDQVKICHSQCKNLVDTCTNVSMKLTEKYNTVPENEMWQLFRTNRLSQLIGSLDKLLSTLGSIKALLQACGREWCKMGLVLSIPPCEKKTLSKFGLLNDDLCLNLDAIYYALHLRDQMEFKWNDSRCRYMLVNKDSMTGVAAVRELTESDRLELEKHDRDHFLRNLMHESILAQEKNSWIRRFTRQNDSHAMHKFAAVLKKRMKQVCDLSKDTCSDQSFYRIDHLDLKTKNKLSGGSSKLVYKGEWCGQVVAIGISSGRVGEEAVQSAVQREAALMLKVQHPHIVEFYGWAFTEKVLLPPSSGEVDEVSAGYLVMEWMERDLRSEIDRCKRIRGASVCPFPLAVAVDILLQIVGAMIHMHNLDIMHRDLKAANCLVSVRSSLKSSAEVLDFYIVKLIDFGESKVLKIDDMSLQTAKRGTSCWMAPEVKLPVGDDRVAKYNRSADVYSFGMTCYEVITGKIPFQDIQQSPTELIQALKDGRRPDIPPFCPAGFQKLMSECWAQVPGARPDFKEIQKELWTIKGSLEQWN